MNNYPDFKNFNYANSFINNLIDNDIDKMNMYNKSFEMNKNDDNLFDPYNGLIRGNLFKDLYVPYKRQEPYEIKPMNEQAKLLTDIDALCFSMIDLNLYLDINSNNKEMIDLFNQYRMKYLKLLSEYEERFGPITLNSNSLASFPWNWDDMTWQWDN